MSQSLKHTNNQPSTEFQIEDVVVGENAPPVVVAEMSGNHNQSLERAFELVDAAAEVGVKLFKIQTYTPKCMTLDVSQEDFVLPDEDGALWGGRKLFELFEEAHTPWEWHKPIVDRCRERGMIPFSTPFSVEAVEFLEELEVPVYKVASFEQTHYPLLERIARTGKPMIISTGMATEADIAEILEVCRGAGATDIALLKCTSAYPATPKAANIATIPHMRSTFQTEVGLSDHTLGIGVAIASVYAGATIIEKHFTLSRDDGGVDAAFSLEPTEFKSLIEESQRAWEAKGTVEYGPSRVDKDYVNYRRSLYVARDIEAGETITEDNLKVVRPGFGLHPRYYKELIGKKVASAVTAGTRFSMDLVDQNSPPQ